jgi:hypothetical protein
LKKEKELKKNLIGGMAPKGIGFWQEMHIEFNMPQVVL